MSQEKIATEPTESTDPRPSPRTFVSPNPTRYLNDGPVKEIGVGSGENIMSVGGGVSVGSVDSVAI